MELMQFIDEETSATLGMMADAAHRNDDLVRVLDESAFDEGDLPATLDQFDLVFKALFMDGQCVHTPGFTGSMLATLRRARTYIVQGVPKTLGGEDLPELAEIETRALKRMSKWAVLASATVAAEFPDHSLFSCFQVFALSTSRRRESVESPESRALLTRLAGVLGLGAASLIAQTAHYRPYATTIFQTNSCTSFEAWKRATKQLRKTMSVRACDELVSVLARWGAWLASSSDVERGFSRAMSVRGGQCQDEHVVREEDVALILDDKSKGNNYKKLREAAGKLWLETYG